MIIVANILELKFSVITWYKILKFILLLLRIYLIKFFEVEMVNTKAHGHSDLWQACIFALWKDHVSLSTMST